MLQLEDSSELEVALDSLGSFFNHLIDTDYHQDDTGTSQGVEEEVTIISSDSEPLPRQKNPKSNPESKIFTSLSSSGSSLYFEAIDS